MGCDIHMVLERKHDNKWVGVHAYPYIPPLKNSNLNGAWWHATNRNYELFADIAGVRGPGPEPRGLPEDLSDLAVMKTEDWGDDAHSHTWLLGDEAITIFAKHILENDEWVSAHRVDLVRAVLGIEDRDEYRLIIFFDN